MDRLTDPRILMATLGRAVGQRRSSAPDHQGALLAAAERDMGLVAPLVLGDRFGSPLPGTEKGRRFFDLPDRRDSQVRSARIWVDAIPLDTGTIASTATNTTSDHYVLRISDRLPTEFVGRVLAHAVGETFAIRERAAAGLTPVREDLLGRGTALSAEAELSAADMGRIGELNWLAEQGATARLPQEQRTSARTDFSALLDQYGMRPTAEVSDERAFAPQNAAARARRLAAAEFLTDEARLLLEPLGRPIEQLDPADAAALQSSRDAAMIAERQVAAFIGRRDVTMPMPGYDQNGLPLARDQLEPASTQWTAYREQLSDRVDQKLTDQLAAGELPRRKVVIGGGASLSGRDPEALLIDGAGRWHLDPAVGIVQSADQDRDLAQWMGVDPYQGVADPRHRIPIHAVRLWEDQLATQGDVINGHAGLRLGKNGELIAEITRSGKDGVQNGTPLRVACDGVPTVATGLPPELVPGNIRGKDGVESRSEAVRLVGERLAELEGQNIAGATELRAWLTGAERNGLDAGTVLAALDGHPLKDAIQTGPDGKPTARLQNCFSVLGATQKWEQAREDAPGRVLMGDEVADGRFDARDAQHWIIAGNGGTGVANAEIILRHNPTAHVTIVGSGKVPEALKHQVQYGEMYKKFGEEGQGRLHTVAARLGEIETVRGEDGRTVVQVRYQDGEETKTLVADGYVASLGRTNPLPAAVQQLADQVRDGGGKVSGDLMFDKDDQYIGYGLTFAVDGREHRVDVNGAASWQLPREVFPPETGIQGQLFEMGGRALPPETGNAFPGFAPTARQSVLRARAVAEAEAGNTDAVQRRSTIPERWRRPGPTTETDGPTPAPRTPNAPESHLWQLGTPGADGPDRTPGTGQPGPPKPQGPRAPASHLWQTGVPQTPAGQAGRPRPTPAPAPAPDFRPPTPDRGLGD
ncbi:hypothetical protein [Streptomyces sp. NPDC054854]